MPNRFTSDGISFGQSEDVESIKAEYWPHIRAKGYRIIVKPFIRPDNGDILIPQSVLEEDKHHSVHAQVIDIGPVAYTDEKICGGVSWCEVGDWVFVPRAIGARVAHKHSDGSDVILRIVNEDDIIAIIKDPTRWEIRINATKY